MKPTIEQLKEYVRLDEETGRLYWVKKPARRIIIGKEAGSYRPDGYGTVNIFKETILVHHVVFALYNGYWPTELDHANGIPSDNKPSNLREATRSQNNMNRMTQCNNTSGSKGVYFHRNSGKWHARIKAGGKFISLKYHATVELASAAYQVAAKQYHGEFARGAY